MKKLKIGRWTITRNGIQTIRDNGVIYRFSISDIWSSRKIGDKNVYYLPIHLCSKGWVSNIDLLDFNSAYIICQEIFKSFKPKDFPEVSWSETIKKQYKRFKYSMDINSFEGRKQFEFEKEYQKGLKMEEQMKLWKINIHKKYEPREEVFGDRQSRKF